MRSWWSSKNATSSKLKHHLSGLALKGSAKSRFPKIWELVGEIYPMGQNSLSYVLDTQMHGWVTEMVLASL